MVYMSLQMRKVPYFILFYAAAQKYMLRAAWYFRKRRESQAGQTQLVSQVFLAGMWLRTGGLLGAVGWYKWEYTIKHPFLSAMLGIFDPWIAVALVMNLQVNKMAYAGHHNGRGQALAQGAFGASGKVLWRP